jgi:hypothetical protein
MEVMTTLPKVSRIMLANCVAKKMTTDREMNPPVSVLVYASLLNLRNCIDAKRSHFFINYLPTERVLSMIFCSSLIITKYIKNTLGQ